MASKVTYITYNEGIDAKHLHLGNLVHDYRKPFLFDPYIEKTYKDIEEPAPEWATSTSLGSYALTLGKGLPSSDEPEDASKKSSTGQRYRVAAAAKTTKIEVKDPEDFLHEVTLNSPKAQKWFSSHLSAAAKLADRSPGGPPEIWMLTGSILMTHATWTSLSSDDHSFTAGLQAPFDPTGVSAIRRSSVSDGVRPTFGYEDDNSSKNISGAVIHETGKYPGTRIWAAQWQKVNARLRPGDGGGAKDESAVQIKVVQNDYAHEGGENAITGAGSDQYWDAFLDAVDDYE